MGTSWWINWIQQSSHISSHRQQHIQSSGQEDSGSSGEEISENLEYEVFIKITGPIKNKLHFLTEVAEFLLLFPCELSTWHTPEAIVLLPFLPTDIYLYRLVVYTEVIWFFLRQSGNLKASLPHSTLWAAACVDTSSSFSSSYLMKTWMCDVSFPQVILFKKNLLIFGNADHVPL